MLTGPGDTQRPRVNAWTEVLRSAGSQVRHTASDGSHDGSSSSSSQVMGNGSDADVSDLESIRVPSNASSVRREEIRLSVSSGDALNNQIFSSFEMVMAKLDQVLEMQEVAAKGEKDQLAWLVLKVDELARTAERRAGKKKRQRSEDARVQLVRSETDSVLEDAMAKRRVSEKRTISLARDVAELQGELRRRVLQNCSQQLSGPTSGPEAIWGRQPKARGKPEVAHALDGHQQHERQTGQRSNPNLAPLHEATMVLPGMPQPHVDQSTNKPGRDPSRRGAGVSPSLPSSAVRRTPSPAHTNSALAESSSPEGVTSFHARRTPQGTPRISSGLSDGDFRGISGGLNASFSRSSRVVPMEALRRQQNQRLMAGVASGADQPELPGEEEEEQQLQQQAQPLSEPESSAAQAEAEPQVSAVQELAESFLCGKLATVSRALGARLQTVLLLGARCALFCVGLHTKPHSATLWAAAAAGRALIASSVVAAVVWTLGGGFGPGHVLWPERLLAAGSLAALCGSWAAAKRHQEGRDLLLKFGAATGFDDAWDVQAAIFFFVFWFLWLVGLGLKCWTHVDKLEVAAFAVISGTFLASAHSMVNSCRGLGLLIDSFCLHIGVRSLALDLAVQNWNVVQACLRDFGEAMQVPFTALVLAFFSCSLATVAESLRGEQVVLTPLLPCIIVLLAVPCVLGLASLVTGKCQKVHSFVNSLERGQAMDLERQYLVDYIQKSGAGFYISDLCFTGTLAWRVIYTTMTAVFLSSRIWPVLATLRI